MMEERSVGLAILFTVLTCGLYGIYWFIKMTDEVNTLSWDHNVTGGVAFLLSMVTCGLYTIYWNYNMGKKLVKAQEKAGRPVTDNSILYLILSVFGLQIISYAIIQSEINALV